jgi:ABC-2 type transport system ATP-binding protein
MTVPITATGLSLRYGDVHALDGVDLEVPAGTICAVLGRNGAGKSSLHSILAAYRRPTAGTVRVDGEDPYENARLMSETCLIRGYSADGTTSVSDVLEIARLLRPRWDDGYAERLLERFEVPRKAKLRALSKGRRAALAVSVGLATRAPLTIFDEPHLGMDAPSRYAFYDELLADYVEHPRTILFSTHHIDEAARLFEHVVVLDHGRVLLAEPSVELQGRGAEVTGRADAVDAFTARRHVLAERQLGRTKAVAVFDRLDDADRAEAARLDIEVGPLPLQDLFVHLTAQESR